MQSLSSSSNSSMFSNGNQLRSTAINEMLSTCGLPAAQYIFGVRSNHLSLTRTSAEDTEIRTKVELAEINGSETFIHANYDRARVVVQADGVHPHRMGTEVSIYVNPSNFFVFDQAGTLVASPTRNMVGA